MAVLPKRQKWPSYSTPRSVITFLNTTWAIRIKSYVILTANCWKPSNLMNETRQRLLGFIRYTLGPKHPTQYPGYNICPSCWTVKHWPCAPQCCKSKTVMVEVGEKLKNALYTPHTRSCLNTQSCVLPELKINNNNKFYIKAEKKCKVTDLNAKTFLSFERPKVC